MKGGKISGKEKSVKQKEIIDWSGHYSMLIDQLPQAFFLGAVIRNERGDVTDLRLIRCNPLFTELFLKKDTHYEGQKLSEVLKQKDADFLLSLCNIFANGHSDKMEIYSHESFRLWTPRVFYPEPELAGVLLEENTAGLKPDREGKDEVFRLALNSINDGLWDWDVPSGKVYYSRTYFRMLGYDPTEFDAHVSAWESLIHPEDRQKAMENNQACINNESQQVHVEYRMKAKDGSFRWILGRGRAVKRDAQGKAIQMIGTHEDITDRKISEQLVQTSKDKLKKLLTEKERVMQILAHDLRNPFHSLLGFTELMRKNLQQYDLVQVARYLEILNETAGKGYQLLEDLLLWGRLGSGRQVFKPERILFREVCDDLSQYLQASASLKKIRLECSEEADLALMADLNMLKTILRNLVSNAIKFTPEGGLIRVVARRTGDMAEISVTDNGVGMSREVLEGLWDQDRDYQSEGTGGETGSGLGLLLVRDLLEKHQGYVRAESTPGKGSTFVFTLPQSI